MLKRRLKKKEYLIFCDLTMKKAQQHLTMRSKTYRLKKKTYRYEKQRIAKKFMDENLYRC